ncbi:MAG: polyprenyl synthetase family protein [Chitinophagaceae bacterium]
MHTFQELIKDFGTKFEHKHFPETPASLYDPCDYFLTLGGKRIRPILCLMANELFAPLNEESYNIAYAVELFHNFTLIHDDMMDAASLRRGKQTVHTKYGYNTALLSGDVMMIKSYEYLAKLSPQNLKLILPLFNKTAKEVCEGQQLDIDFEARSTVSLPEYIHMISLKTSVLLAACLAMGAILGGAGDYNQQQLYEFGLNLGIAFQIQDDYLDAFGDPEKFGKDVGGDIKQNKKTFLLIHALEVAGDKEKLALERLLQTNEPDKVQQVLAIFKSIEIDVWANELKKQYFEKALQHLDKIAVTTARKEQLLSLANYLIVRDK